MNSRREGGRGGVEMHLKSLNCLFSVHAEKKNTSPSAFLKFRNDSPRRNSPPDKEIKKIFKCLNFPPPSRVPFTKSHRMTSKKKSPGISNDLFPFKADSSWHFFSTSEIYFLFFPAGGGKPRYVLPRKGRRRTNHSHFPWLDPPSHTLFFLFPFSSRVTRANWKEEMGGNGSEGRGRIKPTSSSSSSAHHQCCSKLTACLLCLCCGGGTKRKKKDFYGMPLFFLFFLGFRMVMDSSSFSFPLNYHFGLKCPVRVSTFFSPFPFLFPQIRGIQIRSRTKTTLLFAHIKVFRN